LPKYFNGKEVMKVAEKKKDCGCGCIAAKPAKEKQIEDRKKTKKSK